MHIPNLDRKSFISQDVPHLSCMVQQNASLGALRAKAFIISSSPS